MKILITSGFLGAGKTTFISHLSKKTNRKFVIMENEYAQANVDSTLLETENGNINIWELTEGCICCSMKSDFATSILTIANTLDPDYLIVEPTGVGQLSAVIRNIREIEYERIQLLKPVTLVDVQSYFTYMNDFEEIYSDQIMYADKVLLTKLDGSSEFKVFFDIKEHFKDVDIIRDDYRLIDDSSFWEGFLEELDDERFVNDKMISKVNLSQVTLSDVYVSSVDELLYKLRVLTSPLFGRIYRAKGYVRSDETNYLFQLSDAKYEIMPVDNKDNINMVVIGSNLKKDDITDMFKPPLE